MTSNVASKFTSFDTGNLKLDLSKATKTHSDHNNAYHVIWVVLSGKIHK